MSARLELLLALADDALVLGHRHVQWTGVAPHLEEDLAFTSIGLDAMGHALVWYRLAAELTGRDADELALGRPPERFRCCALVERPDGDWAFTIVRHWLADTAETARLEWLGSSAWRPLADAAAAPLREQSWHLRHAQEWMDRLVAGPDEARERLAAALTAALPEAAGLFAPSVGETELVADGTLATPSATALARWRAARAAELVDWGLGHFVTLLDAPAGERTRRTDDFAELWRELTGLHRAHPGARW